MHSNPFQFALKTGGLGLELLFSQLQGRAQGPLLPSAHPSVLLLLGLLQTTHVLQHHGTHRIRSDSFCPPLPQLPQFAAPRGLYPSANWC